MRDQDFQPGKINGDVIDMIGMRAKATAGRGLVELIDNFVRPVSLALRLFGNMTGDHLVLEIFTDLTKVIIPVIFYALGAFVSLIQAFVFTILSIIYLSLALEEHEHAEHAEHGVEEVAHDLAV